MSKKLLALMALLTIVTPSYAAYEEVECSTDQAFAENSCNQCFNGGSKMQGDTLGLLTDIWVNPTDVNKILYKEEQTYPFMVNLNSSNVEWTQTTDDPEVFWKYTDQFNNLYSEDDFGYILEAGKSITWLESSLSHAYNLAKNTAGIGENIGMLIYPIVSHEILSDGEVTMEGDSEHRECVLFKSGEAAEVVIDTPKNLPQTGPAEVSLLLILAMILGFGVLKFKTKS